MNATWTAIAIMGAAFVGLIATTLTATHGLAARIDSLGVSVNNRIDSLGARLDARMGGLDARIGGLDARIDANTTELMRLSERLGEHIAHHPG